MEISNESTITPPKEKIVLESATCSLKVARLRIITVEKGKDTANMFSAKVGSNVFFLSIIFDSKTVTDSICKYGQKLQLL